MRLDPPLFYAAVAFLGLQTVHLCIVLLWYGYITPADKLNSQAIIRKAS